MAFWSGATLNEWIPRWQAIDPFIPDQIDGAAYTLRMGREFYVTPDHKVRRLSRHKKQKLTDRENFVIPPGQFAFLLTEEYLKMPPDVLGFISLKTRYKWRGLINVSGFHVDPGFEGHLIYSVYNAGPSYIHLQQGDRMFLIWFANLDKADHNYVWRGSPIKEIAPQLISQVGSEILSLQSLSAKIGKLEQSWFHMRVVGWFILTLLGVFAVGLNVLRFGEEAWKTAKIWFGFRASLNLKCRMARF